jgi:hypothetical protein
MLLLVALVNRGAFDSCVVSGSARVAFSDNDCAHLEHAAQDINIAAMRGERENFQLVLPPSGSSTPNKLAVKFSDLSAPKDTIKGTAFSTLEVGYVNVKKTTRYSPSGGGWTADPLLPLLIDPTSSQPVIYTRPDNQSSVVWVSLNVPSNATPGQYNGTVNIQTVVGAAGTTIATFQITLTVWPLTLPAAKQIHLDFPEIWSFNQGNVKKFYGDAYSNNTKQLWFDMMTDNLLPPDDLYHPFFSPITCNNTPPLAFVIQLT